MSAGTNPAPETLRKKILTDVKFTFSSLKSLEALPE
jgi:hypothetical protein